MALLPPDPLFRLKADMGYLHCICFAEVDPWRCGDDLSSDDLPTLLLAAGERGVVHFWDLVKNRQKFQQTLGTSIQAIHSHAKLVIVQEKRGMLKIFSPLLDNDDQIINYTLLASFPCSSGFCRSQRLDAHTLIAPHDDQLVAYDLRTLIKVKDVQLNVSQSFGELMCVECAHNKEKNNIFVLAGYESGDVLLLDYATGRQMAHATFQPHLTCMTLDGVSLRGVVGAADSGVLQVFAVDANLRRIDVKCEVRMTSESCAVVKVRPDRKVLVAGSADGRLRVYSWRTLRLLASIDEHRAAISDVQFNSLMAVTAGDGVISLWNLYN